MVDIFSRLLCLYCEPNETLELIPLITSDINSNTRINEGIITCSECQRFYMIKDEILYLSRDSIREKEDELSFLNKWKSELPDKLLYSAKPHNLTNI